jgi:hypothetical protein
MEQCLKNYPNYRYPLPPFRYMVLEMLLPIQHIHKIFVISGHYKETTPLM